VEGEDAVKRGAKTRGDPRVRYTRKVLEDSLLGLMRERPVSGIGIKEICAAAGVSRSTFYTYYRNAYDLLEQIEEETVRYFEETVNRHYSSRESLSNREAAVMFQTFLDYIADNRNSIQVLLSENGDMRFQEKFFQRFISMSGKILKRGSGGAAEKVCEGYSVFVVHGAVGLVRHWLKDNMSMPVPDMVKILVKLTAETRR